MWEKSISVTSSASSRRVHCFSFVRTHFVTPSFDPLDVVDFVRGSCCSFSTISSICLLNSANFGSRSSRGLPREGDHRRGACQSSIRSIDLPEPNIFELRAAGSAGWLLSLTAGAGFWERGNSCRRGRFSRKVFKWTSMEMKARKKDFTSGDRIIIDIDWCRIASSTSMFLIIIVRSTIGWSIRIKALSVVSRSTLSRIIIRVIRTHVERWWCLVLMLLIELLWLIHVRRRRLIVVAPSAWHLSWSTTTTTTTIVVIAATATTTTTTATIRRITHGACRWLLIVRSRPVILVAYDLAKRVRSMLLADFSPCWRECYLKIIIGESIIRTVWWWCRFHNRFINGTISPIAALLPTHASGGLVVMTCIGAIFSGCWSVRSEKHVVVGGFAWWSFMLFGLLLLVLTRKTLVGLAWTGWLTIALRRIFFKVQESSECLRSCCTSREKVSYRHCTDSLRNHRSDFDFGPVDYIDNCCYYYYFDRLVEIQPRVDCCFPVVDGERPEHRNQLEANQSLT